MFSDLTKLFSEIPFFLIFKSGPLVFCELIWTVRSDLNRQIRSYKRAQVFRPRPIFLLLLPRVFLFFLRSTTERRLSRLCRASRRRAPPPEADRTCKTSSELPSVSSSRLYQPNSRSVPIPKTRARGSRRRASISGHSRCFRPPSRDSKVSQHLFHQNPVPFSIDFWVFET